MTPASRADIAVASDLPLVADVVVAALTEQGFRCAVARWPAPHEDGPPETPLIEGPPVDVGLMISDFDRVARIRSGIDLLIGVPTAWLVLTSVPRGPLWGALLELGALHVAPSTLGIEAVCALLDAAAERRSPTTLRERRALVATWCAVRDEHDRVVARLATMTPRETEVLQMLYAGSPVRTIAKQLDVAEATVRTQVKRVLRKLDVRSQLAAVAVLEHVRRTEQAANGADAVVTTMWLGRHVLAAPRR